MANIFPGRIGDRTFEYEQAIPSDVWTVNHDLNKYPSVTVLDSTNREVRGDVEYIDKTKLIITFNGSFSGRAILN